MGRHLHSLGKYSTAAAFLLLLFMFGCTPMNTRSIDVAPDPSILRVGITPDAPPLIYRDSKKEPDGLEVDFAKKLGKQTNRKIVFVELPWKDQIPALLENRTDIIMSAMSITPAREYRIAFSRPYLRSGQILLVRLEDSARFSTGIYSLMNSQYIIGTITNTTGDLFISKNIHGAKIKQFTDPEVAVKALIKKDIDVFIYDAPMVCHYAAINENSKLSPILTLATEEYLAWGIRREDTELLNQANSLLGDLRDKEEHARMVRARIPYM